MKIIVDGEKKAMVFELDNCAIKDLLPLLVRLGGEPLYVLKNGDVGEPRREYEVEPFPATEPVKEPNVVPLVPEPTPA